VSHPALSRTGHAPWALTAGALGVLLGVAVLWAGRVSATWVLLVGAAGCLPLLFLLLGSMRQAFRALLILSLTMTLDVFIGYSDRFQTVRPGVPITLSALVLVCLYGAEVLAAILRKSSFRAPASVTIPFGLLVAWAALSILVAPEPGYVLQAMPGYVTSFLICLYAVQLTRGTANLRFTVTCIALAVLMSGLVGLLQYVTGGWPSPGLLGGRESEVVQSYQRVPLSRVSGLLSHPNTFAVLLNGLLPLVLALAFVVKPRILRVLCVGAFLLGAIAMLLTYSRAGWTSFAVSIALLLIVIPKRRWHPGLGTALIAVVMVSVVTIILAATPLYARVTTRLMEDDQGAGRSRIPLAAASVDLIRQHPFTGVGVGNYKFASPIVADERGVLLVAEDDMPMRVHNLFLLTAAELGLPGLLLLLTIIVLFFAKAIRAARAGDEFQTTVAIGLACGLVANLTHSMFEPATLADASYLTLSFLGGCMTGLGDEVGAP
jgi:O-antigen ligase